VDGVTDHGEAMSPRALALGASSSEQLERAMRRGRAPDLDALVGWQWRGMNVMPWTVIAGIRRFVKGFERRGAETYGYNCPVARGALHEPWRTLPDHAAPKRFGYYLVHKVDPTSRDNAYLDAVLLDYGRGGNPALDPTSLLRDYVVAPDPSDPDLLLGKAYLRLGPAYPAVGFFVLERFRRAT
jgi:hypothetical protein